MGIRQSSVGRGPCLMLRITILTTLLLLVSGTGAHAGSALDVGGQAERLGIGAQIGGAQAFGRTTVRASLPSSAMLRTINGVRADRAPHDGGSMMALLEVDREKRAVALPVTDSVSLGVGYQYLRQEDLRLEVAETASLDDGYSTHNVVLRARWQF